MTYHENDGSRKTYRLDFRTRVTLKKFDDGIWQCFESYYQKDGVTILERTAYGPHGEEIRELIENPEDETC